MDKASATILYIINYFQRNLSPSDLGKVKLNKILWFADRAFMHKNYNSITGAEYIKNPQGPVIKKMDNILKKLEKDGYIKEYEVNKLSYIQKSFSCLKEPNLECFNVKEINTIDEIIMQFATKTAKELSDLSHDESWEKTKNGEVIPIEDVFLQDIVKADKKDIVAGF